MTKFQEFLKAKGISDDAYKAMDAGKMAELFTEHNEAQSKAVDKAIEAKASKEDIMALKQELLQGFTEQQKALNDVLKEQGLAIKRISEMATKPGAAVADDLKSALKANADKFKAFRDGGKANEVKFEVKAVGTMSLSGSVTGEVPQAEREPGLNRIKDRTSFVRNWIQNGTTSSNVISWVEQANREGSVGGTTEGAKKNQIDFALVVADENVKKRTAFIKVTEEMLKDIDFIESEIRTELLVLLELDIDNQTLQGSGTGNDLNGIITLATAFAAGDFAGTIDNANNYDVLRVAINQIMIEDFMPTVIFMHPTDATAMQLTKATDGQYITFPFVSADGTRVLNIPIVLNTGVPVDSFLVMDGSYSKVFDHTSMEIRVGYENDDFTKNLVTFLIEWRGVHRIKGNDIPAFVTGEFSTAKAALETA